LPKRWLGVNRDFQLRLTITQDSRVAVAMPIQEILTA
jgi:hypothetical protein